MKRSKFNLSHYKLFSADMGKLIPCGVVEVLPGDSFQHHTSLLVRVSPMAAPVYHGMTVRVHHWFVPHRLTWTGWEDFITGGPTGTDTQTPPQLTTTATEGTLLDYMGVPPVAGVSVSALPVRAFNLIWNENYRDQDLQALRSQDMVDVPNICWEKDYLTTARPWAQKGAEVTVPVETIARSLPVVGIGKFTPYTFGSTNIVVRDSNSQQPTYASCAGIDGVAGKEWFVQKKGTGDYPDIRAYDSGGVLANVPVNEFRRAFAIQRMQEARARFGSRYSEYLRYCGVTPSDARLQDPEYLGGGSSRINVSEVLQTAPEAADGSDLTDFGVGDMYGHGVASVRSNAYRRFFEEHGYVISVFSVRPKAMYESGIERTWLRKDKEDFFQKELQFIGQQEVLVNEVQASAADGNNVFGYSDRYQEYRQCQSGVAGEFRDTLNYWHMAREFEGATPALNSAFVTCSPTKRIFNEQTQHCLWVMAQHKLVARRAVDSSANARIM